MTSNRRKCLEDSYQPAYVYIRQHFPWIKANQLRDSRFLGMHTINLNMKKIFFLDLLPFLYILVI